MKRFDIEPGDTDDYYIVSDNWNKRRIGTFEKSPTRKVYFFHDATELPLIGKMEALSVSDMQELLSEMIKIEESFKPKNPNISYGC